jgi:hypothetical protein
MKTYFNLDEKLKKIFNYFSIFTIVLGTTFGSLNSAMAAEVDLTNTGSGAGTATYVNADINDAADTLINSEAASVTFDTAAAAIVFDTLVTTADLALTITIDDSDDNAVEVTDAQGDITVTAGSTLTIAITDGILDLGADLNNVGTGTSTITIAAGQEVTTTGVAKTIDADITGATATTILDVNGTATFAGTISIGVLEIDGVTTFSSDVTASGAATIDAATTIAGDATFSSDTEPTLSDTLTFTGSTLTISGDGGFLTTDANNAKLLVDGAVAQTIAGAIKPDDDDEAILENSNVAATVTFNEQIGAVGGDLMKLVDTDTGTTSVFKKEVGTNIIHS